jgi:hypothetical protein
MGGRKVYVWGKNGLLRAGWEKEKRGKEKKKKQKKKLAGRCSWLVGGERKQREKKKKKKKKSPTVYVAGCMARKKIYISPAGDMGCVAGEGKNIYCRPGKKNNKMEFKILKYGRQYRSATHSVFSSQLFFSSLFFFISPAFVLLSHQPHTQVFSFSAFFSSLFFSPQLFLLSRRYPLSPEDQTCDPTPPELQSL